tara:strand:+ start:757 stop:1272 length:516 start_codon:yes stop_codon:yes gene_type:complete
MTTPDPETGPEPEDEEVDLFAELGVQTGSAPGNVSDGLEAFMDDEDDTEVVESAPQEVVHSEEEDDDEDMFATLGVSGPAVALSSTGENDILSAFMDEEEDGPQEPEVEEETKPTESAAQPDAKAAYRMVLETVWVDGILDPGEVNLLARKREDLGISFEEHLDLVRDMLG